MCLVHMGSLFTHLSLHLSHPPILGCRSPDKCPLRNRYVEDGTYAQEETPQDGPQLGDQVKLHHFTQLGVEAGSVGF